MIFNVNLLATSLKCVMTPFTSDITFTFTVKSTVEIRRTHKRLKATSLSSSLVQWYCAHLLGKRSGFDAWSWQPEMTLGIVAHK